MRHPRNFRLALAVAILLGGFVPTAGAHLAAQTCADLTVLGWGYAPQVGGVGCSDTFRRYRVTFDIAAFDTCTDAESFVFEVRAIEAGGPGSAVPWTSGCAMEADPVESVTIDVPIFPSGAFTLELWRVGSGGTATLCDVITPGPVDLPPCPFAFIRMDANNDGQIDLADAIFSINSLFVAGPAPPCPDALDANDDGRIDIADGVATLAFLFTSGPPPPAPGLTCGADTTDDTISECLGPTACP